MRADTLRLASDLAQRGEPFALVTVVRREAPSSTRVGDAALITQGGAFHGWLGGSCTQSTAVREALAALRNGVPRLIALSTNPQAEARPGVIALPLTCHSGGSVDLYVEPVLPATDWGPGSGYRSSVWAWRVRRVLAADGRGRRRPTGGHDQWRRRSLLYQFPSRQDAADRARAEC